MGGKYTRLEEKIKETGEYTLVEPLDIFIMQTLPVEGSLFAGLYPLGETALNITKKLPGSEGKTVASSVVQARLRSLSVQGLVIGKESIQNGKANVWQRTRAAEELLGSRGKLTSKKETESDSETK